MVRLGGYEIARRPPSLRNRVCPILAADVCCRSATFPPELPRKPEGLRRALAMLNLKTLPDFTRSAGFVAAPGLGLRAADLSAQRGPAQGLRGLSRERRAKRPLPPGRRDSFPPRPGYASATAAVREALAACDKDGAEPAERLHHHRPERRQAASGIAIGAAIARRCGSARAAAIALRDLTLDTDAWPALEGLEEKPGHKAFAISLRGPMGAVLGGELDRGGREGGACRVRQERARQGGQVLRPVA